VSYYECAMVLLTVAGLIGLFLYVKKTTAIAKATQLHNELISKPAVTAEIVSYSPESFEGIDLLPFECVRIAIENHTKVHANIKIKLKYLLRTGDSKDFAQFDVGGNYDGQAVWNLAAKAKFIGHLALPGLSSKEITSSDDLIVGIALESSPFNRDAYQANPSTQYKWMHLTKEWAQSPVPSE